MASKKKKKKKKNGGKEYFWLTIDPNLSAGDPQRIPNFGTKTWLLLLEWVMKLTFQDENIRKEGFFWWFKKYCSSAMSYQRGKEKIKRI